MKYFDANQHQLVYLKANATSEFWDSHWNQQNKAKLLKRPPKHRFICGLTSKYLPKTSRILEGGCGLGDKVRALQIAGFKVTGVDFAKETVAWVNKNFPSLNVVEGDVMKLESDDGSFDGYWSLGVIEHFYHGYDQIIQEAHRVLRPEGILFLTFPAMNGIRWKKAIAGKYKHWIETHNGLARFYQFALAPDDVISRCRSIGFEPMLSRGMGSLKGIEDEFGCHTFINIIKKIPFGGAAKASVLLDFIIGEQIGHSRLLVLKKI